VNIAKIAKISMIAKAACREMWDSGSPGSISEER
jgi:hypothetical protein